MYASGDRIKRGIFRSLPASRNINGKKVRIKYDIISIKRNGEKENYHTENTSSDLVIYFGNKDIILSPGIYEYDLVYKTTDQIGFFDTYDEFYWNVNGTLWDFALIMFRQKLPCRKMQRFCKPLVTQGAMEPVSYTHLDVYKRQD